MTFIIIFIIVVFLISLLPSFFGTDKKQIQKEIAEQSKLIKLISENVTNRSSQYINKEFTKAINIDEVNKTVQFFSILNNSCKTYSFDDIIQSEVIIDNNSVTRTNRGKQLVGTVVGAAIAGVGGMVIGGLSSEQITNEMIKKVELKIILNDMNNSIFKINFLSPTSNKGLSKDSPQIRNAISAIDRWHGYFTIIIRQQNKVVGN